MAEPARQLPSEDRSLAESLQKSEFERARMSAKRSAKAPSAGQVSTPTGTSNITPFPGNTTNAPRPVSQPRLNTESLGSSQLPNISAGSGQPPSPTESSEQQPESPANNPRTEREATQLAIERQQKNNSSTSEKLEKLKSKQDEDAPNQGVIRRTLAKQRIKSKEKKLKAGQKNLESLQKLQKMQEGSAWLLRFAWLNIISTWGATSLYIMFHYMMAYLTPLSIIFVKFGEEWVPAGIKRSSPEASKTIGKSLEIPETGCCIGTGCCFLMLIGAIGILIALIAYIYLNPYDFLIKAFPHMSWKALKCLGGVVFGVSGGKGCS